MKAFDYDKLKDAVVDGRNVKLVKRTDKWATVAIKTQSGAIVLTKYKVQDVSVNDQPLKVRTLRRLW